MAGATINCHSCASGGSAGQGLAHDAATTTAVASATSRIGIGILKSLMASRGNGMKASSVRLLRHIQNFAERCSGPPLPCSASATGSAKDRTASGYMGRLM